jgi:hypothetical protein
MPREACDVEAFAAPVCELEVPASPRLGPAACVLRLAPEGLLLAFAAAMLPPGPRDVLVFAADPPPRRDPSDDPRDALALDAAMLPPGPRPAPLPPPVVVPFDPPDGDLVSLPILLPDVSGMAGLSRYRNADATLPRIPATWFHGELFWLGVF